MFHGGDYMKKWIRNSIAAIACLSTLGLSACSLSSPDKTGGGDPIVSSFGTVALVEYVDNNTKFTDYNGEQHTYQEIVDRQLTAMAQDIATRLWTIYGDGSTAPHQIITDTLNNEDFLTIAADDVVVKNTYQYYDDNQLVVDSEGNPKKTAINLSQDETGGNPTEIYQLPGVGPVTDVSGNIYLDLTGPDELGYVQATDIGSITDQNPYKAYNHYYYEKEIGEGKPKKGYGVIFKNNQASLFNNLSNLLFTMNEKINNQAGNSTIAHEDIEDTKDYQYNLRNVLNFKDSINGGPRWAVVAKWNDGTITDENVAEGGVNAGQDPRSDDYYQFFFYFNKDNLNKTDFEAEVKSSFQKEAGEAFKPEIDHLIITEQPAWAIQNALPTDQKIDEISDLTAILKRYLASIVHSRGNEDVYLHEDVTTDDHYNAYIGSINYTANWIDLYYKDIFQVIKENIIGKDLWGENNDLAKGAYLQQLSDDLYEMVSEYSEKLDYNEDYYYKLKQPSFVYDIENSKHIKEYCDFMTNHSNISWTNFDSFLIEYLTARNYQGYDLLVPTLLRNCAEHTFVGEESEPAIQGDRWFVSSKSGMSVYDSPDNFTGDNVEIKPAKNYKSVLFFAKEATDLTKYSIMVFFGNVQQAFAVRPMITLVNGNGVTKEITTLTTEDYTLSGTKDTEYVDGNKETGKYIVKADHEYTGYEEASFIIEFNKGSIVGPGSYTPTLNPTIADNDWVLQTSKKGDKVDSVDTILNAYNYIQISFEQFDLNGNAIQSNVPYGFVLDIVD